MIREGDRIFRTYFVNSRGDEAMGSPGAISTSRRSGARRREDSPEGYPQTPPYQWWRLHDEYET